MNDREFILYGPIGSDGLTAATLAKALQNLGPGPVTIRINSPGGDAFDGLAMCALVRQHGNVTAIVDGLCASAATFVAFAAKRVLMAKEAMLMLHAPHSETAGNSEQLRDQADLLDRVSSQIASIYATRSGKTVAEVSTWLSGETWFTAEQAKASKLIDEIIEDKVRQVQTFAHAWRFASAPAAIAAQLDPTATLRAENARLAGELAQARVDAELVGLTVTDEARAALTKTFLADAAGARSLIAGLRDANPGRRAVVVIADVSQRIAANADKSNDSPNTYDRHMARVNALRNQ